MYLTDNIATAETYASLACDRRGGTICIIEVEIDDLDRRFLEPDDFDLQDMIDDLHDEERDGDIGLISGTKVDPRLSPYRKWKDVPFELSLATSRQVAYTRKIPPEAILNFSEILEMQMPDKANVPKLRP